MPKLDMRKAFKPFYAASAKQPTLVDIPPLNCLMVDGQGDPNSTPAFPQAVEALYGLSYTLKFMLKKEADSDYTVMGLEGLWWVEDMSRFDPMHKEDWLWTLLIVQPHFITQDHLHRAADQLRGKKNPPALGKVRFEVFHEGLSAQIMHIGHYSAEGPTIEKLHRFIAESGHQLRGKHHEIYLGDPRRTAPEKLKTILRQPVRPA